MKIAVVGSYGVGMTMRVRRFPGPGETISGASYAVGPGGKGSNQAIATARLGATVSLLTAVGDDLWAEEARKMWATAGIETSQVKVCSAPTMVGFILVDEAGENQIVLAPGALDELSVHDVDAFREKIRDADILLVSMEIPLVAVIRALQIAREEGTRTLLNPAPAQQLPDNIWPLIDFVTPNQTEAPILLGLDPHHGLTDEQLLGKLRERTSATVVITRGQAGSLFDDGNGVQTASPVGAPKVIDTTGAGDSFTAALAVAISEGREFRDAVQFASAAGSHAVTVEGVIDSLPTRADIENLIGIQV
jgi:ribokinase